MPGDRFTSKTYVVDKSNFLAKLTSFNDLSVGNPSLLFNKKDGQATELCYKGHWYRVWRPLAVKLPNFGTMRGLGTCVVKMDLIEGGPDEHMSLALLFDYHTGDIRYATFGGHTTVAVLSSGVVMDVEADDKTTNNEAMGVGTELLLTAATLGLAKLGEMFFKWLKGDTEGAKLFPELAGKVGGALVQSMVLDPAFPSFLPILVRE